MCDSLSTDNQENSKDGFKTQEMDCSSLDLAITQSSSQICKDGLLNVADDNSQILDCDVQINKCNQCKNITTKNNEIKLTTKLIDHTTKLQDKFSTIPVSLEHLIAGHSVLVDPSDINDISPPSWFSLEKFKIGQKFGQNYFFGLAFAETLSLLLLFSIKDNLDPLIFTKKSSTPYTAFKRYLSTIDRVRSWYRTDIFNPASPGHKNIRIVRRMHRNIRQQLSTATPEEISQRTKLKERDLCCPLLSHLQEDTKNIPSIISDGNCPYLSSINRVVYFNQFDMAMTQFAFVGLMILYPDNFGASNVTKEELDGFVHLWAVIGYLLGIQDKFNFCIGGLNECQKLSQDAILHWFKPNFRDLSREWEHMSCCVVEGSSYYVPGNNFASSLLYLCWVLNIKVPKIESIVTWWDKTVFRIHYFVFCKLSLLRIMENWLLNQYIDNALNASDTWLHKKEKLSQQFINNNKLTNYNQTRPSIIKNSNH